MIPTKKLIGLSAMLLGMSCEKQERKPEATCGSDAECCEEEPESEYCPEEDLQSEPEIIFHLDLGDLDGE